MSLEPFTVARAFADVLESMGIVYCVGGSLASSARGAPRSTLDVDMVADIAPTQVAALVAAVEEDYYIAREAVDDAILRGASFNLIHFASGMKIDVFIPARGDALSRSQLRRASDTEVGPGLHLRMTSAEDIVLQKLRWFRLGGGTSERQWRDVQTVLRAARPGSLDWDYLEEMARAVELTDLLERARDESTQDR